MKEAADPLKPAHGAVRPDHLARCQTKRMCTLGGPAQRGGWCAQGPALPAGPLLPLTSTTLAAASVSEPNWVLEGRSVPVGGECLVLSSRGQAAAQPVPWPASLGGSVAVGTWVCVCPGLHAMAFPSADM